MEDVGTCTFTILINKLLIISDDTDIRNPDRRDEHHHMAYGIRIHDGQMEELFHCPMLYWMYCVNLVSLCPYLGKGNDDVRPPVRLSPTSTPNLNSPEGAADSHDAKKISS